MENKDDYKQEFEEVSKTKFWRVYHEKVMKYRKDVSRRCETDPIDRVERAQGEAFAVDHINKFVEEITGVKLG